MVGDGAAEPDGNLTGATAISWLARSKTRYVRRSSELPRLNGPDEELLLLLLVLVLEPE